MICLSKIISPKKRVRADLMSLKNIHIVLVRAENPVNIGQTARAMKNFGTSKLILVNCVPHKVEEAFTPGWKARNILKQAVCLKSLSKAFSAKDYSVGFTTRVGRERGGTVPFPKLPAEILQTAKKKKIFLVFGNEKNGLSNEEISFCFKTSTVPAAKAYSSLNLSHAVVAVLSRLFAESGKGNQLFELPASIYPSPSEFKQFDQTLYDLMLLTGYKKPGPVDEIHKHMAHFFKRVQMDKRELHLLESFFARIKHRLR